jgi:Tol biopolymer transport system component
MLGTVVKVRLLASAVGIAIGVSGPAWAHGTTERVSLGPRGVQGDFSSIEPSISVDGRFVAFFSYATNLVLGDTNRKAEGFVRDRQTGTTERVSVGSGGAQDNGISGPPSISADGRFVAFASVATNLVPGDTNGTADVFVRDRLTGTTRRVSFGPGGVQGNDHSAGGSISADGRFVAFVSNATNLVPGDTNGTTDVFVRNRQTGTTRRLSLGPGGAQGDGQSSVASISADGGFVAFQSEATNLVPGDTNDGDDVFVGDGLTGKTRRVSLGSGGVQGNGNSITPAISADGRFIVFGSSGTNLVPGDTNGQNDVFVRTLAP